MNIPCYGNNKVLDIKSIIPLFTRSMPLVYPILPLKLNVFRLELGLYFGFCKYLFPPPKIEDPALYKEKQKQNNY